MDSTTAAAKLMSALLMLFLLLSAISAVALASSNPRLALEHHRFQRHSHAREVARSPTGELALFNREVYAYSSQLSLAQEARRYSVMILQAPYGWLVSRLHRYNPRLQVYMYQYIMYANPADPHGLELCTSLPAAVAHNWFLRGPDGRPLRAGLSSGLDIGIPSFQHACASHAVALAKRYGFDGVFLDGVGALPDYQFGRPVTAAKYPTHRGWMAAMTSFLVTMSDTVHAHRLKVIANIGGPQAWQRWSPLLDGSMEESWTDGGLGLGQQVAWWKRKLQNAAWSEAHGRYALLHSHNAGEAGNVYGLASMLLIAAGHSSYSTSNTNYVGAEEWFPEYGLAQRLGPPAGHYLQLRNGVYERRFANGLVVVNPTLHSAGPVRLHGSYSGSGLVHATSVSLGPTSGLILLHG
ncbi:MAG TPA: putative glycoside hydrolase [Solirubrobacteraceae bacterium]